MICHTSLRALVFCNLFSCRAEPLVKGRLVQKGKLKEKIKKETAKIKEPECCASEGNGK